MGARVVYADGPSMARLSPTDTLAAAGLSGTADVTLGWTIEHPAWLDDPSFRARTVLAGYALADGVADGRITPLPVRLSAVASMLETDPPDVAVIPAVRRGSSLVFGRSVGWADVLARTARSVVVEVDETGIEVADLGGPEIPGNIVAVVPRPASHTTEAAASRPAGSTDLLIGGLVASLVPDGATLQFGPGGIGEGIVRSLTAPVRIWSGLFTDAMAELHGRGLLAAPAIAAYAWGGAPIRDVAAAGMLQLSSSTVTHDLTRLSSTPRFVACNTALQVGLDGSVNIERVGGRTIAAVGGHADFCAGASRSVGGLSVIALRSTARDGNSTIVDRVEVVSTPRCDVDVVVTEHGIADLRGVSDTERAERLTAIAAAAHRRELRSAADILTS